METDKRHRLFVLIDTVGFLFQLMVGIYYCCGRKNSRFRFRVNIRISQMQIFG